MSTLLAYLQDCTFLDATDGLHLTYATRDQVATEAKNLLARLFPETKDQATPADPDEPEPVEVEVEVTGPTPPKRRRAHGLAEHLKDNKTKRAERGAAHSTSAKYKIIYAMKSFEATGKRPEVLQQVLHAVFQTVSGTQKNNNYSLNEIYFTDP